MVNLILPSNNKPIPTGIEPNRAQQTPLVATNERPSLPVITAQKPASLLVQWANLESNKTLTTEQKTRLIELNPNLAKTLIGQIKGQPQPSSTPLSAQNITLLKQRPLQLLALTLNNTSVRMVTASNIDALLNVKSPTQLANASLPNSQPSTAALPVVTTPKIPLVQTPKGWQIASNLELKTALQTAATQLLKQNLPIQTSSMPLFKMAQALNTESTTALSQLPKTQAHIQALANQIIEPKQAQNPQALGQTLQSALKTSTVLNQITGILQSLNTEVLGQTKNLPPSTQALTGLEKSIQQLQSAISTPIPVASKKLVTQLLALQTAITPLVKNQPVLPSTLLTQVQLLTTAMSSLTEHSQKGSIQEQLINPIAQQINVLLKPFNHLNNSVNTSANNAVLQLLGLSVQSQQAEQQSLQQNVQQQLKNLLQQVGAKLQLNQLSHLGLDSSRENLTPFIQQLQGEVPLRFNEQVLPLTYHIQGFEEKAPKENKDNPSNETKEKTQRWQVFMSLDLPNDETLHCKLSLVDDHINTTLWAESETLCRKTQKLIGDLETRFTQAGLTVETLQCFAGKPPQDETSINYNLVDVTT